jgi:hypothetical protein
MLNLVEKIEQKLDEYDIPIFDKYENEANEQIIIAEDMIILVKDKDHVGVAFHASTKPEISAANIGILYSIKDIKKLAVMESFVLTKNEELISGDEAHRILKETMELNTIKDFETEKYYKMLLMSTKGHQC